MKSFATIMIHPHSNLPHNIFLGFITLEKSLEPIIAGFYFLC